MNDYELALPLPTFPMGYVSGKVWSTFITTQQAGIYQKSSLAFAIYLVRLYDVRRQINVPSHVKN